MAALERHSARKGTPTMNNAHYAGVACAAAAVFTFAVVITQTAAPSAWQNAPTVSSASRDAIPFRHASSGMFVYASLGGVPHNMLLDTGATSSTVTLPVARTLVARKQAYVMPGFMEARMADGSVSAHQTIVVRTVKIGRHVLHDVQMIVTDDGSDLLLGLSELSAIGSFTIDQSRSQIRFN
jgi:clan AA aspartic protease (TIGR02281 family)